MNYRNLKAVGLRFEKAVGRAAKDLRWGKVSCGQWFEFCDFNGRGYCQTDVLIIQPIGVIVLECKLTEVEEAQAQLEDLYLPVVSRVYDRPAYGVIVARHLTRTTNTSRICDNLSTAIAMGGCPILHWIGRGPIGHVGPVEPRWTLDYALSRSAE